LEEVGLGEVHVGLTYTGDHIVHVNLDAGVVGVDRILDGVLPPVVTGGGVVPRTVLLVTDSDTGVTVTS